MYIDDLEKVLDTTVNCGGTALYAGETFFSTEEKVYFEAKTNEGKDRALCIHWWKVFEGIWSVLSIMECRVTSMGAQMKTSYRNSTNSMAINTRNSASVSK